MNGNNSSSHSKILRKVKSTDSNSAEIEQVVIKDRQKLKIAKHVFLKL